MQLSIVMIVKNEETHLEECLESLTPIREALTTELIIVDTGSTDRTLEIARSHTNRVYCHEWNNDFGAMRNLSISYAKGEWIFVLDGDEVVKKAEDLIEFFKSGRYRSYKSATIKINNYTNKQKESYNSGTLLRLFKRKGFKYIGAVHEQPQAQLPIYYLETVLFHYGYQSDDFALMEYKFRRNVPILLKELERDPENPYIYFQLSQSYNMYNDFSKALEYIEEAYQLCKRKKINLKQRMYIYVQLLNILNRTRDYEKLIAYAQEAIDLEEGYVDFHFFYAGALAELGQIEAAIPAYERFIYMVENYQKFVGYNDVAVANLSIGSYEGVKGRLCELYFRQGKYQQAIERLETICDEKVEAQIAGIIVESFHKLNQLKELVAHYRQRGSQSDTLRQSYINAIEVQSLTYPLEKRKALWQYFIEEEGDYGLLNRIRLGKLTGAALIEAAESLDFNQLPTYYGEILYYCLKGELNTHSLLSKCHRNTLTEAVQHILTAYQGKLKELYDTLFAYVREEMPHCDLNQGIVLRKALLSSSNLTDEIYLGIFKGYLLAGMIDLRSTYQHTLLQDMTQAHRLRTHEDRLFLYFYHFMENRITDTQLATAALREAVREFPEFKRGLSLLTQEFQRDLGLNPELQGMIEALRLHLNQLISEGRLIEAKEVLVEFEKIQPEDEALVAIKSMIQVMEEQWEDAEKTIQEGLIKYPASVDLLCNGAYLYQVKGNSCKALDYYQWALEWVSGSEEQEMILAQMAQITETIDDSDQRDLHHTEPVASSSTASQGNEDDLINILQELMIEQRYEEALQLIENHGEEPLGNIQLLTMKSMAYLALGEYGLAEELLKKGIELDPLNLDLIINMGYLYQQLDKKAIALEFYDLAMELSKDEGQRKTLQQAIETLRSEGRKLGPDGFPKTSIVILTYNNLAFNQACIESIRRLTQQDTYEIIVVDNASTDGTAEWLKAQKDLKLILNSENLGFPKGCNQGIEAASSGNDILLLNNDTIVTPNWLVNLKIALHSQREIGAVGAVTNSCSNLQVLKSDFKDFKALLAFAEQNNISDPSRWEERLRLIGFCLLIKRETVNQVGFLEERFTPGNYEDDDYSLRIRQAGYRLLLCKDSFIYHHGGGSFKKKPQQYIELLERNQRIFQEKWGFSPEEVSYYNYGAVEILKARGLNPEKILEINCRGAATLLALKELYPKASMFGIDPNPALSINTSYFATIYQGSLMEVKKIFKDQFDVVIHSGSIDKRKTLDLALNQILPLLKDDGVICLEVSKELGQKKGTLEKGLKSFKPSLQWELFQVGGPYYLILQPAVKAILQKQIPQLTLLEEQKLKAKSFDLILDQGANLGQVSRLLRRLEHELDLEKNLNVLNQFLDYETSDEQILRAIERSIVKKEEIYNLIAALLYQKGALMRGLTYLERAFLLNSQNKETVYNMALILMEMGEVQTALTFIESVQAPDQDLIVLKQQIMEVI